ncbi:hypothetical protein E2C01_066011 [Portunus trituberculatus]|uniref:Uncharacterized protein n=1 Tax=Portunus trituberculatus TaxID=210409 RepID=A0A5B7HPY9_PORTR|nr:hypothetical protein [Portunus trituberculatus]
MQGGYLEVKIEEKNAVGSTRSSRRRLPSLSNAYATLPFRSAVGSGEGEKELYHERRSCNPNKDAHSRSLSRQSLLILRFES